MMRVSRGARRSAGRLLLAVLAAAQAGGCHTKTAEGGDEKPPVEVHCVTATRVALEETLTLRGRTAPPPGGDLPMASQIAGRITESRVHEGDHLTRGAVIATVDDLAPRAAATGAGAALARAKAADTAAQSALGRARDLSSRGIASKKDVEDAVARAEAAHAEVDAESAAVRLASGTLGRVDVRSTFDGVVTKVWRGAGALVDGTAATPVIQLATTSSVELVADATERDLARVEIGQKAEITLATGGARLAGAVVARSSALDPATGLGTVRIRIDGPAKEDDKKADDKKGDDKKGDDKKDDEKAAPPPLGAFGRVVIAVGRREGALVLPPSALRGAVAEGTEIALCKGEKVEIRAVTVGYRDPRQVEIVEGLKEGDRVAVDHVLGLDEESKIAEAKGDAGDEDDHGKGDKKKGEGDKAKKDDDKDEKK
jgi:membrane fusion protein (multidrug efflux system)